MPRPDFNSQEQYLIDFTTSNELPGKGYQFLASYLVISLIMGGYGFWTNDMLLVFLALLSIFVFRIYEEYYQAKWMPIWKSLILKYEDAIREAEPAGNCANVDDEINENN